MDVRNAAEDSKSKARMGESSQTPPARIETRNNFSVTETITKRFNFSGMREASRVKRLFNPNSQIIVKIEAQARQKTQTPKPDSPNPRPITMESANPSAAFRIFDIVRIRLLEASVRINVCRLRITRHRFIFLVAQSNK